MRELTTSIKLLKARGLNKLARSVQTLAYRNPLVSYPKFTNNQEIDCLFILKTLGVDSFFYSLKATQQPSENVRHFLCVAIADDVRPLATEPSVISALDTAKRLANNGDRNIRPTEFENDLVFHAKEIAYKAAYHSKQSVESQWDLSSAIACLAVYCVSFDVVGVASAAADCFALSNMGPQNGALDFKLLNELRARYKKSVLPGIIERAIAIKNN